MKYKVFLLFLLLLTSLQAHRNDLMESFGVSLDGEKYLMNYSIKTYKEALPYMNKNIYSRFTFNKALLKDETYYMIGMGIKNFVLKSSHPYHTVYSDVVVRIDASSLAQVDWTMNFKERLPAYRVNLLTEFEYKYLYQFENYFYGLSYGVMFYAFIYSFIFFLFNRQKLFLYYGMIQLAMVGVLITLVIPNHFFADLIQYFNPQSFLVDWALTFSLLFHMSFLQTSKYLPRVHKLMKFFVFINVIDLLLLPFVKYSFLYEVLPIYFPLLLMIGSALVLLVKGHVGARYYMAGWMAVLLGVVASTTKLFDVNMFYAIHIAFPVEAIVFSIALAYKVDQVEKERLNSEKMLTQQSKLASMGEMLAAIAHQWRQPLTHLSYAFMNLKTAFEKSRLDKSYFEKKSTEINEQLEYMSQTIEDFRSFFQVDKAKQKFVLYEACQQSLTLLAQSLEKHNISFTIEGDKELETATYKGELVQVLFNLINNAKEVLVEREIELPKIGLDLKSEGSKVIIKVFDNAGGIDEKIINTIFDPYFTTKEGGMGMGLYMARTIVHDHMKGVLEVHNTQEGSSFSLSWDQGL